MPTSEMSISFWGGIEVSMADAAAGALPLATVRMFDRELLGVLKLALKFRLI